MRIATLGASVMIKKLASNPADASSSKRGRVCQKAVAPRIANTINRATTQTDPQTVCIAGEN